MISNGSSTTLDESIGNLPQMGSTILEWLVPMVFIKIVKTVLNHRVVEASEETSFRGVWQPMSSSKIDRKPEGQRSWKWYTCHTSISLNLENDEIISYKGKKYRVEGNTNYSEYGYFLYELVEDFT